MIETSGNNNPLALIVEDDETLSFIASEALRMAEFDTEIIRDGQTAKDRLLATTPSVVVLDLHLPHVSGEQILDQIRADDRLTKTRVILATADPGTAQMLRPSADLVLIKPYSFTQLRELASRFRPKNMIV